MQKKIRRSYKKNDCKKKNVKYEARIELSNSNKIYVVLTEIKIKTRIEVYKTKFQIDPNKKNHLKYKNLTDLFKEINKLKEKNQEHTIL